MIDRSGWQLFQAHHPYCPGEESMLKWIVKVDMGLHQSLLGIPALFTRKVGRGLAPADPSHGHCGSGSTTATA